MPNEVIHATHRLAAACKKYKGIVFTDSEGKIINDSSPNNDSGNGNRPNNNSDNKAEITEITGVGNTTYPVSTNTISTNNSTNNTTITGVGTNNESAGMGNIIGNIATNTGNDYTHQEELQEELPVPDLQEMHTTQETDDDYTYEAPTRHKIEMIEEMNATNMQHNTEFASENTDAITKANNKAAESHEVHTEMGNSTSHGYNLRPRPTRQHTKISLIQTT